MTPRRVAADRTARRRAVALAAVVVAIAGCSDSGSGAYDRAAAAQQRARASSSPEVAVSPSPGDGAEDATPSAPASEPPAASTVASPPGPPNPIPTNEDQTVGVFEITDIAVGADPTGDLRVHAQVRNTGDDVRGATFTAYVFQGGDQVGTATGSLTPLPPGGGGSLTLGGLTDFTDQFDQVVFQVDAEFGQP